MAMAAALRLSTLLVIVVGFLSAETRAQDPPQVTLPGTNTIVTGRYVHYNESEFLYVDTTFETFLGIPFAEPPVGDLRFRKPVKKGDMGSAYSATEDMAWCLQFVDNEDMELPELPIEPMKKPPQSEDCLYLSVFTSSPRVSCL